MPVNDYEGCDTQNWQGSAGERMRNPASSSQQKLDARDMDRAYDDGLFRPQTEAPLQRPGGRLRESKDREQDFAYSGNGSDLFKGRGSPSSSFSRPEYRGPGPARIPGHQQPQPEHLDAPPEPGKHPSFDAKVAAEFLRLRDARARGTADGRKGGPHTAGNNDNSGKAGSPAAAAGTPRPPPPPPQMFESDVERAMRDLEQQLAQERSLDTAAGPASASRNGPSAGTELLIGRPMLGRDGGTLEAVRARSISGAEGGTHGSPFSAAPLPVPQQESRQHEGMLSQMDSHRAAPGGGKGRSGGLRDMWGGNEGSAILPGYRQQRQQRRQGPGLAGMWQDGEGDGRGGMEPAGGSTYAPAQRQGPGLKGMWGEDDPGASVPHRPQRQGPGLRGLFSGPDTAAADEARSDAQAAYLRALDRDVQERRAFDGDREQFATRDRHSSRTSPHRGNGVGGSEHGTSLAGIGAGSSVSIQTPRATPRQQRESQGLFGVGGDQDRLAERAKKAAYADELRRQIAEKEAREAAAAVEVDDSSSERTRRRASTGARGRSERTPATALPYAMRAYPHQNGTDSRVREPTALNGFPVERSLNNGNDRDHPPSSPSTGPPRREFSSSEWSTPGPGSLGAGGGGDTPTREQMLSVGGGFSANGQARVTAARRRLVEDVYGGGEMGAALSGSGYRRASTGSCTVARATTSGVAGVDQIGGGGGGGGGGDPVATASSSGSSHLRTGAGVQSLNQSEHGEKLQRKAAALEQQRALQEQIAAKARAKKEEEDGRKREEEHEARQQRERLRLMEADDDKERRRKQAEQQEQLEGLYRQQEEALRKKRVGGSARRQSDGSPGVNDEQEAGAVARVPAYDTTMFPEGHADHRFGVGVGGGGGGGGGGGSGGGNGFSSTVARQTSLRRSSLADVDDLPAGALARAEVLRSSPPGGGVSAGSPSSRRPTSGRNPPAAGYTPRGTRPGNSSLPDGHSFGIGASLEVDTAVNVPPEAATHDARGGRGGAYGAPPGRAADGGAYPMRNHRVLLGGETEQGPPAAPAAGRQSLASSTGEPPLRTSSALVPVTSDSLFPADPGNNNATGGLLLELEDAGAGAAGSFSRRRPRHERNGRAAPVAKAEAATAAHDAAAEDEMDVFVTSWQTKHLRRRGHEGSSVDVPSPEQLAWGGKMANGSPANYSRPPTISGPPPRGLLRSSQARRSAGSAGGGLGKPELEESLAATSRLVDPSMPMPMPTRATAGGVDGRMRRRRVRPGVLGEEGMDASEQSLTSDSMLFYLTGQQQEAREATMVAPTAANGSRLRKATIEPRKAPRERSGHWEGGGVEGSGGVPPLQTPSVGGGSAGSQENEEGQMSPLTRLLAETPVRLPTGGSHPKFDGNHKGASSGRARWDTRGNRASLHCHDDPQASADAPFARLGTGGGTGHGSRSSSTAEGTTISRRARAPATGDVVPEGFVPRGGRMPWEGFSEGVQVSPRESGE